MSRLSCRSRPAPVSYTHLDVYKRQEIPQAILDCFGDSLTQGGDVPRLYVTLGQFSIIRLERDSQLLIPVYDYCLPEKECTCGCGCECQEDPCEMFRKVQFPFNEFFPPNSIQSKGNTTYQEVRSGCCRGVTRCGGRLPSGGFQRDKPK